MGDRNCLKQEKPFQTFKLDCSRSERNLTTCETKMTSEDTGAHTKSMEEIKI